MEKMAGLLGDQSDRRKNGMVRLQQKEEREELLGGTGGNFFATEKKWENT